MEEMMAVGSELESRLVSPFPSSFFLQVLTKSERLIDQRQKLSTVEFEYLCRSWEDKPKRKQSSTSPLFESPPNSLPPPGCPCVPRSSFAASHSSAQPADPSFAPCPPSLPPASSPRSLPSETAFESSKPTRSPSPRRSSNSRSSGLNSPRHHQSQQSSSRRSLIRLSSRRREIRRARELTGSSCSRCQRSARALSLPSFLLFPSLELALTLLTPFIWFWMTLRVPKTSFLTRLRSGRRSSRRWRTSL